MSPRVRVPVSSPGEAALALHLRAHPEIPAPERQYRFADAIGRDWRFDFAWPEAWIVGEHEGVGKFGQLAVEVEGEQHRTRDRFRADMERLNVASALGWWVLRFRPREVEAGMALDALLAIFRNDRDALLEALQRRVP